MTINVINIVSQIIQIAHTTMVREAILDSDSVDSTAKTTLKNPKMSALLPRGARISRVKLSTIYGNELVTYTLYRNGTMTIHSSWSRPEFSTLFASINKML
jgi:hypothetical protein